MWERFVVGINMPIQPYGEKPTAVTGVYFLFDEGGGLLYIGKSVDIEYRLIQHERAGKPFTHFGCMEVPLEMLDGVESAYLEALRPYGNRKPERSWALWQPDMVKAIQELWANTPCEHVVTETVIDPPSLPPVFLGASGSSAGEF